MKYTKFVFTEKKEN